MPEFQFLERRFLLWTKKRRKKKCIIRRHTIQHYHPKIRLLSQLSSGKSLELIQVIKFHLVLMKIIGLSWILLKKMLCYLYMEACLPKDQLHKKIGMKYGKSQGSKK